MTSHTLAPGHNSTQPGTPAQAKAFTADGSTPQVKSGPRHEPSVEKSENQPRMVLDLKAIEAAKADLEQGAVTPHYGPWRNEIIELLNDSLATELVCALRYKRHHFTAQGLS